jgi:hypothetical protein
MLLHHPPKRFQKFQKGQRRERDFSSYQCYHCDKMGHIAKNFQLEEKNTRRETKGTMPIQLKMKSHPQR